MNGVRGGEGDGAFSSASGYDSVSAEFYDHNPAYRALGDIDFYRREAAAAKGAVLELACGTGRVLLPLARDGREVVGLDLSPVMLSICRERLAREPEAVRARAHLMLADMRSFDLGRRFALVIVPFHSFQHLLTVEDQLDCLAAARRHLIDGGRLILDVFNPDLNRLVNQPLGKENLAETEFALPDGRKVRAGDLAYARDYAAQIVDVALRYHVTHPGGWVERLEHRFPLRYLFRFELEHLLARAGFSVEGVYADFEKNPLGSSYPGALLTIARRD